MKKIFPLIIIAALSFNSCKKDGCTDAGADNYNSKADKDENNNCVYSIYDFRDSNGNSTVDINGQQQRQAMLDELVEYIESANTAGTVVSTEVMKKMYANNGYTWADEDGLGMTGSSKQLKGKTALGDGGIQAKFEALMDSVAAASAISSSEIGAPGVTGVWPNDGHSGPYLMSGNGIQYSEIIEKGLMCAVFLNQMTVNYLGGLSADDNETIVEGETYTEMEHHWDEAFGYFSNATDYPTNGTAHFFGKYASRMESKIGSGTKIMNAFLRGRRAIRYKEYGTRDALVEVIRFEIEKVCAATAIHYLNGVIENISNPTARNHELSEAYAFIDGLRYGYNTQNGVNISVAEINALLAKIGADFNAVTVSNLQSVIDTLAAKFGLESLKSSL